MFLWLTLNLPLSCFYAVLYAMVSISTCVYYIIQSQTYTWIYAHITIENNIMEKPNSIKKLTKKKKQIVHHHRWIDGWWMQNENLILIKNFQLIPLNLSSLNVRVSQTHWPSSYLLYANIKPTTETPAVMTSQTLVIILCTELILKVIIVWYKVFVYTLQAEGDCMHVRY